MVDEEGTELEKTLCGCLMTRPLACLPEAKGAMLGTLGHFLDKSGNDVEWDRIANEGGTFSLNDDWIVSYCVFLTNVLIRRRRHHHLFYSSHAPRISNFLHLRHRHLTTLWSSSYIVVIQHNYSPDCSWT